MARMLMLPQFLVGGAVSIGNIVMHALVMAELVWVVQFVSAKAAWQPSLLLIALDIRSCAELRVVGPTALSHNRFVAKSSDHQTV
jgi:hypothetical protein